MGHNIDNGHAVAKPKVVEGHRKAVLVGIYFKRKRFAHRLDGWHLQRPKLVLRCIDEILVENFVTSANGLVFGADFLPSTTFANIIRLCDIVAKNALYRGLIRDSLRDLEIA